MPSEEMHPGAKIGQLRQWKRIRLEADSPALDLYIHFVYRPSAFDRRSNAWSIQAIPDSC